MNCGNEKALDRNGGPGSLWTVSSQLRDKNVPMRLTGTLIARLGQLTY
jgi:hypothetical protein